MSKKNNLELAREVKSMVEKWVDRTFNVIPWERYQKVVDIEIILESIIAIPCDCDEDCYCEDENWPMWGWVFEAKDQTTVKMLGEIAQRYGISVIEDNDDYNTTLFFTGCGYSFYGSHWIPLYLGFYKEDETLDKYRELNFDMV